MSADPYYEFKEIQMKNRHTLLLTVSLIAISCCGCSSGKSETPCIQTWDVESKYLDEDVTEKGTVESFSYSTKDYVENSDKTETKKCNVYLPYQYSSEKEYNILYLLHGTDKQNVDHISTWLDTIKAKTVLDNMIHYQIIDPIIVVCPNTYSYGLYGDDNIKNIKDYSPVKEKSNQNFIQELRYDIVPNVEAKYSTYSKSQDESGLVASRDHRAIAGLSNGARLTLKAGMVSNFDYFSYFGCYSSSIDSSLILDAFKQDKYKDCTLNYMFNADGIFDFAYNKHRKMVDELLKNGKEWFTEENTEYVKITMGYHSARSWRVSLFDSLLRFFR